MFKSVVDGWRCRKKENRRKTLANQSDSTQLGAFNDSTHSDSTSQQHVQYNGHADDVLLRHRSSDVIADVTDDEHGQVVRGHRAGGGQSSSSSVSALTQRSSSKSSAGRYSLSPQSAVQRQRQLCTHQVPSAGGCSIVRMFDSPRVRQSEGPIVRRSLILAGLYSDR